MMLLDAVKERLGEDAVFTEHHLTSFEVLADRVIANFQKRSTGENAGTYEADMMIAADGIHSTVRKFYYPDEGPPKFSGRILWRGEIGRASCRGRGEEMAAAGRR